MAYYYYYYYKNETPCMFLLIIYVFLNYGCLLLINSFEREEGLVRDQGRHAWSGT